MKRIWALSLCMFLGTVFLLAQDNVKIKFVDQFNNLNHPRILYWFWAPNTLFNDQYMVDLDSISQRTPFDLLFLTARDGVNFYDYTKMYPIFARLVKKAHEKHIKIGLQLWDGGDKIPLEHCMRMLGEKEILLDPNGNGECELIARHVRPNAINRSTDIKVQKTEVFKVWAFKKQGNGFYLPGTLLDVTAKAKVLSKDSGKIKLSFCMGKRFSGYSVYVLAQHYYNWNDFYGGYVSSLFREALNRYASIPFDGTALDEYSYMRITPPWSLEKGDRFTERFYSPAMALQYKNKFGADMTPALLAMRYVPVGKESMKIKSINQYMDLMRNGPLQVEKQFYKDSKAVFGEKTFIGVHDTYHNALTGDELWQTGANWWTIPREYGQSDEKSLLPTQMGIAQCASQNILYNMYYHVSADSIVKKAANDLAYGIRTHYHAYNDTHGWGIKLESPIFLSKVSPVENAASLLNRFNPALPKMDVLLVFGMEALQNWYPNQDACSPYELNQNVRPEEISMNLWNRGYRVALVSSDVISEGKLKVQKDGKLNLNGHIYDRMVYLCPQYMKVSSLALLKSFSAKKGCPLIYGDFKDDFEGHHIKEQLRGIGKVCNDLPTLVKCLNQTGVLPKNIQGNASLNEDGSYVQTFYPALVNQTDVPFCVTLNNHKFTGVSRGMIAILTDKEGNLSKFAASGLSELKEDGKYLLNLSHPADIWIKKNLGKYDIQMQKGVRVLINNL
jgi:hypothetical protein